MKKHSLAVFLLVYSTYSLADPITVEFSHDFDTNGLVVGSFTGEDVDGDGDIEFDQFAPNVDTVTAYSLMFTPGPANGGAIMEFVLDLADIDGLRLFYSIGGASVIVAGGESAGTQERFYNCDPPGSNPLNCFVGDVNVIYGDGVNMVTSVTAVPEPSTLALFAIGLCGMGLARRKKRV